MIVTSLPLTERSYHPTTAELASSVVLLGPIDNAPTSPTVTTLRQKRTDCMEPPCDIRFYMSCLSNTRKGGAAHRHRLVKSRRSFCRVRWPHHPEAKGHLCMSLRT